MLGELGQESGGQDVGDCLLIAVQGVDALCGECLLSVVGCDEAPVGFCGACVGDEQGGLRGGCHGFVWFCFFPNRGSILRHAVTATVVRQHATTRRKYCV